jgi:uncharacterized Zn finger protein
MSLIDVVKEIHEDYLASLERVCPDCGDTETAEQVHLFSNTITVNCNSCGYEHGVKRGNTDA